MTKHMADNSLVAEINTTIIGIDNSLHHLQRYSFLTNKNNLEWETILFFFVGFV